MNFSEIKLFNFGQYSGEHLLNLRPLQAHGSVTAKPIILVGGKNGAGKTTLLEAVKLCLYGSASLGFGIKPKIYRNYLVSRIHRHPGEALENGGASVTVSFEHSVKGVNHCFEVQRKWERQGRRVPETLTVWRDGVPLSEQEYSWWEQFLHDLLPPGLADLFFFDGEKIQALAEDPDYSTLARSIRALLGLELIDRLRADLSIYVSRQKRTGGKGLEVELKELADARSAIQEALAVAHANLEATNRLIEEKKGQVEETERHLASEGGEIAAQRDRLKEQARELEQEIVRHERTIAEQANHLLPFAVIPALSQSLSQNLVQEEQIAQQMATQSAADSLMQQLMSQLQTDQQWLNGVSVSSTDQQKIIEGLFGAFEQVKGTVPSFRASPSLDLGATPPQPGDFPRLLHDISNRERREMFDWLGSAVDSVPKTMQEVGAALEMATDKLSHIKKLLLKEPEEEILRPLFERLATLHQEIGVLTTEQESQQAEWHERDKERAAVDRKEEELHKRIMRGDDPLRRIELAKQAEQALVKYEERLRAAKIKEFERQIVACFGRLSHKGRYIRQVHIDPKTFQTTLYNRKAEAIPKEQLSAGEKQIYAIALLWALRLVSGRRVPIIIDTPLGRLDGDHRQNLVQHYFPQASHQVVLLSTDTEIDQELYAQLQPAIARTYHLTYNPRPSATQIQDGYFW
ncbi:MAG: DNA sulfur modification protein DndD [Ardenticatenaceae bacterium]